GATYQESRWQSSCEQHEIEVEERHPVLHAVSHCHFVLPHEQIDHVSLHLILEAVAQMIRVPLCKECTTPKHHALEVRLWTEQHQLLGPLEQRGTDEAVNGIAAELPLQSNTELRKPFE